MTFQLHQLLLCVATKPFILSSNQSTGYPPVINKNDLIQFVTKVAPEHTSENSLLTNDVIFKAAPEYTSEISLLTSDVVFIYLHAQSSSRHQRPVKTVQYTTAASADNAGVPPDTRHYRWASDLFLWLIPQLHHTLRSLYLWTQHSSDELYTNYELAI